MSDSDYFKLKKLRKESRNLHYKINKIVMNGQKPDKKINIELKKVKACLGNIRVKKIKEKQEVEKNKEISILINHRKKHPSNLRYEIFKIMVSIEYLGLDDKKILEKTRIKKRSYESQIKRSPRLQWLKKKLNEYENKNKELPFEIMWGNYDIPHSLTGIKRKFMYPKPSSKKLNQWFRTKT